MITTPAPAMIHKGPTRDPHAGIDRVHPTEIHSTGIAPFPAAVPSASPAVCFVTRIFAVETTEHAQFVDITGHVAQSVEATGILDGNVHVFSRHTTACIRINENEPLLLQDMVDLLERVAPIDRTYRHDDFSIRTVNLNEDERVNGHSHCRSLLMGASETIPVAGSRLLLGRWQSIFLVELDGPAVREFVVQVTGC